MAHSSSSSVRARGLAHGDERDHARCSPAQRLRGRARSDQRRRVETVGLSRRCDDALRAGAGALNDGLAGDVGPGELVGRVTEVEAGRGIPADLAHADRAEPARTQRQGLLDLADHDDLRCAARECDRSRREGAQHVDHGDGAAGAVGTFEQAFDADLHRVSPSPELSLWNFRIACMGR
jgi:hypothetical protein